MKESALIGFLAIVASAAMLFDLGRTSVELAADSAANAALSADSSALALRRKIAAMSTDEKIGQILMVAIPDAVLSDATAAWLRGHHVGGVILLGQNVRTKEQVETLISGLQKKARGPIDSMLFIAADQEGGAVSRFRFLKELTAQKDIVASRAAFDVGHARAEELRALGVNMNFSPVLDVSSSSADFIFGRAFGGNAELTGILGSAMIRGYEKGGIISVAKHFPGHGGTPTDSHKNLPTVSRTASAAASALLPFREAIKENVPMVMIGHLNILEIDAEYPASMSSRAINLLRRDMGYRGVIITDDLGMGAIMQSYRLPDAAVQSVKAGADIVLVVRTIADYDKIYAGLLDAVRNGDIPESRINQSVARIMSLKERYVK